MSFPSPKTVLRMLINICLVGFGAVAIVQAARIGPGHRRLEWMHDLSMLFLFALVAFALFFAEYQLVQGITKRDLNLALGYIQSLGCSLLLFCGILGIYYVNRKGRPQALDAGFQDNILLLIYVFGHVVFLGNVAWSYLREGKLRES